MSFHRLLFLLLALALIGGAGYFTLTRFQAEQKVGAPTEVALYAADSQGLFLVPYRQSVALPPLPQAWAQRAFEQLQKRVPSPYVAALPAHAKLVAATYTAPHWRLVISLQESLGSNGERLLVGALVETFLAGWPDAKDVHLTLLDTNQKPLTGAHTDLSRPLTRGDVANQLAGEANYGPLKATLWWPTRDSHDLIPVQVSLAGVTGVPPRDAFERLLRGPDAESGKFLGKLGVAADALRWGRLEGGIVTLDWQGAVPLPPERAEDLRAVVLSLTEFPEVTAVQFLHRGIPLTQRLGPWNLATPLRRSDLKVQP